MDILWSVAATVRQAHVGAVLGIRAGRVALLHRRARAARTRGIVAHDAIAAHGDLAALTRVVVGGVAVVALLGGIEPTIAAQREPADGGDAQALHAAVGGPAVVIELALLVRGNHTIAADATRLAGEELRHDLQSTAEARDLVRGSFTSPAQRLSGATDLRNAGQLRGRLLGLSEDLEQQCPSGEFAYLLTARIVGDVLHAVIFRVVPRMGMLEEVGASRERL